ncbi:hypothetical protein [Mesorhizobium sp. M7A.F.Ca.ET.027.03.2.1]|uniref:hypothetical protein n=1 Tax=Mesorhizobium sp. M7A.F.Ca.ET.027.03.2.1 TaxID=2496656 RepID=UPI001AEC7AD1|nr:hypothetical protein [Mesorhizobium sp. M7A.F.Ca.ET.027.03.2.1]
MGAIISLVAGFAGVPRPLAGIIAWAVLAVAVSGAVWGGYTLIKHWGAEELRTQIERENTNAVHKGIDARMSLDECLDAGGVYDFGHQRCDAATTGPR